MQKQKIAKRLQDVFVLLVFLLLIGCQSDTDKDRTWEVYLSDAESSQYSSLDQINVSNVDQLQEAWRFEISDMPEGARPGTCESNPIIVDGVLYATSARDWLYAINAETGEQIWSYDAYDGGESPGLGITRGVTYWEDGDDKRILFGAGRNLIALDAKTGKPISTFGVNGRVNLNDGVRENPETVSVTSTSPGIIYNDLIIMGSRVPDEYGSKPGFIQAYNCKTGELVWTFHTIPQPGEPGYETWPEDAYQYAGGVNNWAGMSLDSQRGIVFVPLGSPTYDFYGANRKGKNLYGNSLVALDAATGEYIWHYQTVHHDLWDYDLPSPPNLAQVRWNGEEIDAVAQVTKQGFVFVFNRETGEPLYPIEERSVPASNMPDEEAWPTQPFPLKPEPFARQWMTEEDLTHYSAADHDSITRQFRSMRYEGLYTPPDLKGTIQLPGTRGGANWGGAAYDPATTYLYIRSSNAPDIMTIRNVSEEPQADSISVFEIGQNIYMNYCATCHGQDRSGTEPYPSLIGLEDRMSRETALEVTRTGAGIMPGFASTIEGNEEAIIAFLYQELEQQSNMVATADMDQTQTEYDRYVHTTPYRTWQDPSGNPALTPPWGTLNALNLSTGEYAWQIPLGNNEKLQEEGAPPTGREGKAGPIVTAGGLVFISGSEDQQFQAFDKKTGELIWETTLPAAYNATPSTYEINGKQFVVLSVGGNEENPSGFIIAFARSLAASKPLSLIMGSG